MSTVLLKKLGGLGNQLFRYAHARAFCEQNGHELRMEESPLEDIFTLDGHKPKRPDGTEDLVIEGYRQNQQSLIYSREDCRRWFTLNPAIERILEWSHEPSNWPVAHFRRGDYAGAGYPLISRKAVEKAMAAHGIEPPYIPVSDEHPQGDPAFVGDMAMLPDFYRMMRAPVLFRANSSFSFWAGVLGYGKVFSPVITGLAGGVEHDDVPYIPGNSARLAELSNITELHLRET